MGYLAGENITTGQYNTLIGANVADALTQGEMNVAIGYAAMGNASTTDGIDKNVFVGVYSGDAIGSNAVEGVTAIGYASASGALTSAANGIVAVGEKALKSNTSGERNLAIGYKSLEDLTDGDDNVMIGYNAGLDANSSGFLYNVGVGNYVFDGFGSTVTAAYNTAVGHRALSGVLTSDSDHNTALGYGCLGVLTSGDNNVAVGSGAGDAVSTGHRNILIGKQAGYVITTEDDCVLIGHNAGIALTHTDSNGTVAVGSWALDALTNGIGNVAIGYEALSTEDEGNSSTAVGYQALKAQNNDTGYNTAVGWTAGDLIVAGYANTLIGAEAGTTGTGDLTSGIQNVLIGQATSAGASGATNRIVIGRGATGQADNSVTLGNTSVDDVYMAQDSGATVHCLDVKPTGGALKENLLSNSGWDVWSNSTLENATGTKLHPTSTCTDPDSDTDSTSGWSAHNGSALTSEESVAGFSGSVLKVLDQSGADGSANFTATTVVGKLYKLVFTQKNGDNRGFVTVGNQSNDYDGDVYKILDNASATTYTIVFEASFTTTYVTLGSIDDYDYCYFNDVSLYEVTPGCVAANSKAPDGWTKDSTLDLHRVHNDGGTNTQDGSFYSLKWTPSAAGDYMNYPSFGGSDHWYRRFAGRTVTLGAWVKTDLANHFRIGFYDGSDRLSSYHGASGWEWMEYTRTLADDITNFTILFSSSSPSSNHNVVYISQPMLVFGNSIGSGNYTRPNQEVIHLEGECALTDLNASSFSTGTGSFNLEVESRGKLPKGLKAIVNARCTANDSDSSGSNVIGYLYPGSGYENGVAFDIGNAGLTLANDDQYKFNMPYMRTVDAGMTYNFTASGSSTLDLDIWVRAVEI